MAFEIGDNVLLEYGKTDVLVEIITPPDGEGFVTVRHEGQPNFPVHIKKLKYPAADLSVGAAPTSVDPEATAHWGQVIKVLREQVKQQRSILDDIDRELEKGDREPGTKLEKRERETLVSLYEALKIHTQSAHAALSDSGP